MTTRRGFFAQLLGLPLVVQAVTGLAKLKASHLVPFHNYLGPEFYHRKRALDQLTMKFVLRPPGSDSRDKLKRLNQDHVWTRLEL